MTPLKKRKYLLFSGEGEIVTRSISSTATRSSNENRGVQSNAKENVFDDINAGIKGS